MKAKARKETTKREWTRQTNGSYMCSARLPDELAARLRSYVDASMMTITDTMIEALENYLKERGY